ncbi:MAG: pyrroloquinoline quinone biosynthesis peptide chaperone PqqD [Pseudomonadota bacterium]
MSKSALSKDSIPFLPRGVKVKVDTVRERTVLLAPERTLALDGTGISIMELIDGENTLDQIVGILAQKYDAPKQTIGNDVVAFTRDLINRGYLEIKGG